MKITALLVLKCSASSSSSSGEAADPVVLANASNASHFPYFQRGAVNNFILLVARTVAMQTPAGQQQSVEHEEYKVHSYNRDGLCALAIMDDRYSVQRVFLLLNKVLEEYQRAFGESWRTIHTDSTQPWAYLNEALTKFQEDVTTKVNSMMAEGLVNDRFRTLVYLAEHHITPHFLQRQIGFFLYENATSIQHIHILAVLRQHTLDYNAVFWRSCAVRDSCLWMGARSLRSTAAELGEFCQQRNKSRCISTAIRLSNEFCHLKNKFEEVLEMLQEIRDNWDR